MHFRSKKVKFENLQIGTLVYGVDTNYLSKGVQKIYVTGLLTTQLTHKTSTEVVPIRQEVAFNYGRFTSGIPYSMVYFGFSEKKAQKVLDSLLAERDRRDKRYQDKQYAYQTNKDNLKLMEDKYLGREVMVKVGRDGDFEKRKITNIHPTYVLGKYQFSAKERNCYGSNCYNFSNEGKSWYWYSPEAEIKHERRLAKERYEKELKRLTDNFNKQDEQFALELREIENGANNEIK